MNARSRVSEDSTMPRKKKWGVGILIMLFVIIGLFLMDKAVTTVRAESYNCAGNVKAPFIPITQPVWALHLDGEQEQWWVEIGYVLPADADTSLIDLTKLVKCKSPGFNLEPVALKNVKIGGNNYLLVSGLVGEGADSLNAGSPFPQPPQP